ncbi:MAG TPA: cadherin domain-containing protein, partial [Anaerolineaceae bacterium]|nr:cadherin domain-containing protein [Anaerolineaceae bacterium]HPN50793.1 cadherin domain-containing protein [Anaerolineaceae bacterium]
MKRYSIMPLLKSLTSYSIILVIILSLVSGFIPTSTVRAATYDLYVADTGDNASNDCSVSGTPCKTITYALTQATSSSDTYVIHVAGGIYNQPLGESFPITINGKNITIAGAGAEDTIIYGNNSARIFTLSGSSNVTMQNVKIWRGNAANGGGIYVDDGSSLSLSSVIMHSNIASGNGGAIYKTGSGSVTISSSTFTQNNAANGGAIYLTGSNSLSISGSTLGNASSTYNSATTAGGAIYRDGGSLSISGSTIIGNTAGSGLGGGLFATNSASISVTSSTNFESNKAGYGGAIYNYGSTLTITNSTLYNNGNGTAVAGGGLYNANSGKTTTLNGVTINSNTATNGAGIYQVDGTLDISNVSIVRNNTASSNGGGIYINGGTVNLTESTVRSNNAVNGAGLYQAGGTLNVLRSTMNANTASVSGGAIYAGGTSTATLATSTISANTASGTGLSEGGGGLMTTGSASISLSFMTIALNTAAQDTRSGVYINAGSVAMSSTLLPDNKCTGTFTSGGSNNLTYNSNAACLPSGGSNNSNTASNPISALADNGGLTYTHAYPLGSAAIDYGAASCGGLDQRGKVRPGSGSSVCDVGAFEFQRPTITLDSGSLAYTELDPATIISPNAVLTDDKSTFTSSDNLTVSFNGTAQANDTLKVNAVGLINVTDLAGVYYVNYNSQPIATVTGGYYSGGGSTDLVFTFNNTYTTRTGVEALIRAVAFQNTAYNPNTTSRSVRFQIVHDSIPSNWVSRTITIADSNIAPTAYNASAGTNEDTNLSISYDTNVLYVDPDPYPVAGGVTYPWKIVVTELPNPLAGTLYKSDGVTAIASNTDIFRSGETPLIFKPAANYFGTTSFKWKGFDYGTSGPGTSAASSNEVTYTINVIAVNDPPIASGFSKLGYEDMPITMTITDFTSYYSDVANESQSLVSIEVSSLPLNGTLSVGATDLAATGTIPVSSLPLIFTPNSDWNGSTNFGWRAYDGLDFSTASASIQLTLNAVNDAPVLAVGTYEIASITEDASVSVVVNPGTLVQDIIGTGVSDIDSGAVEGVAIIGAEVTYGRWEYCLGSCTTLGNWITFAEGGMAPVTVSATSARVLASDANTAVRFVPEADFNTTQFSPDGVQVLNPAPPKLTFRAWDISDSSVNGSVVDASTVGGISPFSTASQNISVVVTPVDDAPKVIANPTDQTATEDVAFSYTYAPQSIIEVDGEAIIYTSTLSDGNPLPGWLTFIDTLTRYTGTPGNNDVGTISIKLMATDPTPNTTTVTFNLTITNVNDAPLATSEVKTLPDIIEDQTNPASETASGLFASLYQDIDPTNDPFSGIAVVGNGALVSEGSWQFSSDGLAWTSIPTNVSDVNAAVIPAADYIRFLPAANFFGTPGTLSVRLWDGTGTMTAGLARDLTGKIGGTGAFSNNQAYLSINVLSVGDAPIVSGATTNEDTQTTGGLVIDRNANDSAEVTHFKITFTAESLNGTLYKNDGTTSIANGEFITFAEGQAGLKFTPDANKNSANYLFTFNVWAATDTTDIGLSPTSTTGTVTVNPVADTPSVTSATTNEDVQSTSGLVISRNPADSTETTHFKINNITNGKLYQQDGLTQISNGQFITFAQGNAGLKFTPDANKNSSAYTFNFEIQASTSGLDGGLGGNIITATITVNPVNDAPTATSTVVSLPAVDEDQTNPPGATLTSMFAGYYNDIDPDPFAGVAVVGNAATVDQGEWQYFDGGNWLTIGFTINNTKAVIVGTPTAAGLRFVPNPDYNGTPGSLTIRLWDGSAFTPGPNKNINTSIGGTGAFSTNVLYLRTDVTAVNDAPLLTNPANGTTSEDTPLVFSLPTHEVSIADVDASTGSMQVTLTVTQGQLDLSTTTGITVVGGANGSGSMTFTGSITSINNALNGLTFIPAQNSNGVATMAIWVSDKGLTGRTDVNTDCDGSACWAIGMTEITITAVNDPPTDIQLSNATVNENSPSSTVVGNLTTTDVDGLAATYTVVSVDGSATNTLFTIINTNQLVTNGNLNFEVKNTYTVRIETCDNGVVAPTNQCYQKDFVVTILDINDAPVINNQSFSVAENSPVSTVVTSSVIATDEDVSPTQMLTFAITGGNTNNVFTMSTAGTITVNASNWLDYEVYQHAYTLTVSVTDDASHTGGPAVATALITVNVLDQNDPPALAPATYTIEENSLNGTIVGIVTGTDQDVPATLTYSILSGNVDNAFQISSSNSTGQISVNDGTKLDYEGPNPVYTLTVEVTDDGTKNPGVLSSTGVITINVTPQNEPPSAGGPYSATTNEYAAVTGTINGTDPDFGDVLTYTLNTVPSLGTATIVTTTGVWTYEPVNRNATYVVTFTVHVTDTALNMATGQVTVTVNAVSEAPVIGGPYSGST